MTWDNKRLAETVKPSNLPCNVCNNAPCSNYFEFRDKFETARRQGGTLPSCCSFKEVGKTGGK